MFMRLKGFYLPYQGKRSVEKLKKQSKGNNMPPEKIYPLAKYAFTQQTYSIEELRNGNFKTKTMTKAKIINRIQGATLLEIIKDDSSYYIKLQNCNTIAKINDKPLECYLDFFEHSTPSETITFDTELERNDFIDKLLCLW